MRVLNVMLGPGAGGLEAVAFQYARVLAEAGTDSAMVVNRRSPYGVAPDVRVFRTPGASLANPFNHLVVARAVREFQPDVVIGHGSRGADFCKSPFVRRAAQRGTRFIGVLHGENAKHFHGLDHVIAVSEKLREETIARSGFTPDRISVCPNAVKIPETSDLMSRAPNTIPVIGFLGRFDPCKGLDILIEACAVLKSRGVAFRLDVGGDGPQRAAMRALAARHGLADSVRWLGWVSDKRSFFGEIDVLVMPSREEAVGLVMLEAMAHGRAVVLSDCPGPAAVAGDCGVVFANGDAGGLADSIERLLSDRERMRALAAAGRNLVEVRYSEERLLRDLMASLEELRS